MFQSSAAFWRKFLIPVLLVGGLLLAACAPGALQFDASFQTDDTATPSTVEAHPDDTGTPEATHTPELNETLEPTHTPEAGMTGTPDDTETPEATGTLTATVGAEIEFRGTLTAINGDTWTVNGIVVIVSANTEIKGNLQVGDRVKVEGALRADGSVLAREIEVEAEAATATPVPNQREVDFEGTLTAINGNTWTVNGLAVIVNANTEIEDNPQIGDTVKVEGALQADGSVLAREIKKDHSGSGGDDNFGPGGGSGGDDDSGSGGDDHSGSGGGDDHSGSGGDNP